MKRATILKCITQNEDTGNLSKISLYLNLFLTIIPLTFLIIYKDSLLNEFPGKKDEELVELEGMVMRR
jgi:hypothetical protein